MQCQTTVADDLWYDKHRVIFREKGKEMKHYFAIIYLVLFIGCINSNDKTNNTKEKKEYRNYDFTIWINMKNQDKDFDYIINHKYYRFEGKNNFVYHDDKLLEQISYEYKIKKNSNEVEKTTIKTTKYQLNKQQLDTLYLLTSKLFKVDSLNFLSDTTEKKCNYDGYFSEITFSKLNATYKIQFNGLSSDNIVGNYRNLLSYIENIKNKIVKKSKK